MRALRGVGTVAGLVLASLLLPIAARAQAPDVLVFAAASLKSALDPIAAAHERETGRRVAVSYAASSALARQIESGAPADIFISADLAWMDYLEAQKLIRPETRKNLLGNRLVLIAPADRAQNVALTTEALASALGDSRLATASLAAVPAGRYAKAALQNLGLWPALSSRLAEAENVRAALTFVARGEAPLGIVYESDAKADAKVAIVARFPETSHPAVVYPVALTATARPEARAFLHRLRGPAAAASFAREGFIVHD